MKKSKIRQISKSQLIIGIVITVVGGLILGIVKKLPFLKILSILFDIMRSILIFLLDLKIPLWFLLVVLPIYLFILKSKRLKKYRTHIMIIFKSYTYDTFDDWLWRWEWNYNSVLKHWETKNRRPVCPICNSDLKLVVGALEVESCNCPKCNVDYKSNIRPYYAVVDIHIRNNLKNKF